MSQGSFASDKDEHVIISFPDHPAEDYINESIFEQYLWQDDWTSRELTENAFSTPSLSSSPSVNTESIHSPTLVTSPPVEVLCDHGDKVELKWPPYGQLRSSKMHLQNIHHTAHSLKSDMDSATDNMLADSRHEGCCAKCRMTEAEARKCRLERRREQNRASQRKFRARKEAKIREAASQVANLETYVEFLETHNRDLETTNMELQKRLAILEKRTRAGDGGTSRVFKPHQSLKDNSDGPRNARSKPPSPAASTNSCLSLFDHDLEPPHIIGGTERRSQP